MSHFIEKCIDCNIVISQCRCPSKDKQLRLTVCVHCQKHRDTIEACKGSK